MLIDDYSKISIAQGSPCQWVTLSAALKNFALFKGTTQSSGHIKPLHWYAASRLVIEGGFDPANILPRPPFKIRAGTRELEYDASVANNTEARLFGGLMTKNVDVAVNLENIGPVIAISCKGMTGAFGKNCNNRTEEAIGDCTNVHISYPALTFGYIMAFRANGPIDDLGSQRTATDIAVDAQGAPTGDVARFLIAMERMTGRRSNRDDVARYESVAVSLVDMQPASIGNIDPVFPDVKGDIRIEDFFGVLYRRYDERFVINVGPRAQSQTRRLGWSLDSPLFADLPRDDPVATLGYSIRLI